MTKGARKNTRKPAPPKRKIGRYILLLVLAAPIAFQLKNVDWQSVLPKLDLVKQRVEPEENKNVITNIIVDGDLHYTDKVQLEAAITRRLKSDFVRQDLKGIQQTLLRDPWFKSVSVTRVWPSSLKISIEEQQPIARWGNNGFVNRYGEVIRVNSTSALTHLPVLEGQDENAYDIAKEYLTMSRLMDDKHLRVSSLKVSASGHWRLEVNSAFVVELGAKNISERLSNFLFLYSEQLEQVKSNIARVDMRYPNGIAVSWKDASSTPSAETVDNKNIVSR